MRNYARLLFCFALLISCCGLMSANIFAATFVVDRTDDSSLAGTICTAGASDCSLRTAIELANATPGADLITFDQSIFGSGGAIQLTLGSLNITDAVVIEQSSAARVAVTSATSSVFLIDSPSAIAVTLTRLSITGTTTGNGGAIFNNGENLTINQSTITDSSARSGGIFNNGGTVNINQSLITGNIASDSGGGIYNNQGGTVSLSETTVSLNEAVNNGGGIFNINGTVNIVRSTIGGSTTEGASNRAANGGGIANFFTATINANLIPAVVNLTNSTIANNAATGFGGGYYGFTSGGGATLNSANATIAGNQALNGGGIAVSAGIGVSFTTLNNTIVGDNTAAIQGPDLFGTMLSLGYNVIENTSGSTIVLLATDQNTDPQLGALGLNGGLTETYALQTGSPAIDKGNSGETTDQRGFMRPVDNPSVPPAPLGNNADIGAFEVQMVTAASAFVKGRVTSENGRGVSKASVILTESDGTRRRAMTNQFGYFRFENILVGQTVIISAGSKKSRVAALAVTINENIQDLNLTIQP